MLTWKLFAILFMLYPAGSERTMRVETHYIGEFKTEVGCLYERDQVKKEHFGLNDKSLTIMSVNAYCEEHKYN